MSFASQPIPLRFNISPGDSPAVLATPTPVPTPTPTPGSGDPGDPICTGGNPDCVCVQNNAALQSSISQVVAAAVADLIATRPDLFVSPGSNQIAAGESRRAVLEALCPASGECTPSPLRDDSIVILGPTTISVVVITPAGALRTDGGQIMAACPAGVQD